MSQVFSFNGLQKAYGAIEKFTGVPLADWSACNDLQKRSLAEDAGLRKGIAKMPDLLAWADPDANKLNRILRENGLTIQLKPWPIGGNRFGVVAILKLKAVWLHEGDTLEGTLKIKDKYPAFRLKGYEHRVQFFENKSFEYPVVKIATKQGDVVCAAMYPKDPGDNYGNLDAVRAMKSKLRQMPPKYQGVCLPMVEVDLQPDVNWLIGLRFGKWTIDQAFMQVILKMNHQGVVDTEGTAMGAREMFIHGETFLEFDQSFLYWTERDGVKQPLNALYITPEHWQDPGDLAADLK